jgi:hypothetical protein
MIKNLPETITSQEYAELKMMNDFLNCPFCSNQIGLCQLPVECYCKVSYDAKINDNNIQLILNFDKRPDLLKIIKQGNNNE